MAEVTAEIINGPTIEITLGVGPIGPSAKDTLGLSVVDGAIHATYEEDDE